ncbi:TSN [Cordylochernes scorpioides]|uniref:Translin n=1 Tax=Cordylochernes scorpioides TaxID=51811 RepID=A0ABY6LK03_9ARAC|nr:TSN [Cordylochernes scorpioides]
MVRKKHEESAPKKAKVTISAGKVMAIVFWDCKGISLVDYLPPNTTVNAAKYCEVLTKLRAAIKWKHPGLLSRKVLLVHDNALPHAARTTQMLLENFKWEIFTHPPYSPDLAPSDFHLFPALKLHLGGKHFANDDEVQAEANHWLRRQDTAWYHDHWRAVTQRLVCLAALTVYLEREDLINRDQATEMLLGADVPKNFHLDLEDFLSGTLQLASELTRFAVNSVTLGDFQRPFHVATFLGNLNLGFRLLNLKNDSLRKKYDCLKYDLKKIEEVVYDLTIRGLKELDISPSA